MQAHEPFGVRRRRPAVLVVEDERLIAMEVAATLADAGYEVVTAGSCRDAIERALETDLDCGLLDVVLPDGDCAELAQMLADAGVPFGLTTGMRVADLDKPILRSAPALQKPFAASALLDLVEQLVQDGLRHAREAENAA